MSRAPVSRLRGLLAQPLLHFAVLGTAVFLLDAGLRSESHPPIIPEVARHEVAAALEQTLGRPASAQELTQGLQDWIDTELLYREALNLGLQDNDEVVRSHLARKLRHLIRERTVPDEPTRAELEAQLESHRAQYVVPDRYTLTSVFLNRGSSSSEAQHQQRVSNVLERLREGAEPAQLGDHFPRGPHFESLPRSYLEQVFGAPLQGVLEPSRVNTWQPVSVPRGTHLLFLEALTSGEPRVDTARSALAADLHERKKDAALREYLEELRIKYDAPSPPAASLPAQSE